MKLEDQFGEYELKKYICAKRKRRLIEEAYQELCEDFYQDSPLMGTQVDYELGVIYTGSGCSSLEDFVIDMIEKKERFHKMMNKIQNQEELFDVAMGSLTPRERDVIRVHYFNRDNNLGLSVNFFNEVLTEAQNKLCSYIGGERIKQREEAEINYKLKLQTDVTKWKRSREVS